MGAPAEGYLFEWSVYEWLPGENANGTINDLHQAAIDLAAFITFFLVVIGFSLWKSRKPKDGSQDGSDFFLGGRSLTWPIIGISMPHRADSRPSPTPTSFKGSPCSSAA